MQIMQLSQDHVFAAVSYDFLLKISATICSVAALASVPGLGARLEVSHGGGDGSRVAVLLLRRRRRASDGVREEPKKAQNQEKDAWIVPEMVGQLLRTLSAKNLPDLL